jgi:hypothetical protein
VTRIAHRSYPDPPETFSASFPLLYPRICGLFPAIEFAVAPSSTLPNSSDAGATIARACLNSGDLTATERSGAARSRLFLRSDPLRPIQIERLRPRVPLRARTSNALSRLSAPPAAAHPSRSDFPRPILIERLEPPPSDLDRMVRTPSNPCSPLFPLWRWTRSVSAPSTSVTDTPGPLVSARPTARAHPRPQI